MVGDIIEVDYKKLHLDLENPRLPVGVSKVQKNVLTWIAKSTAIEDLMNAIGTNGFFPGEPLVVYPKPGTDDEYIVIEGNRRLTAVRLLHNPNECEKASAALVDIAEDAKHKPKKIPVVVRPNRQDVLPYLGFRHITGIREWEPLAKARYMKQLFDSATSKKDSPRQRYNAVARTIGSRRDYIKRNLDALAVYDRIFDEDFYEIDGLGEETIKFAVLSTALADDRIGVFVGTSKKVGKDDEAEYFPTDPIVAPKALKNDAVEALTRWLFEKGENKRAVVGESRNLRELGAVIEAPKALAALRKGSSLAYAYRLTNGINDEFIGLLYKAQGTLEEAASVVANVGFDEEAIDVVKELRNLVVAIGKTLKSKQSGDADEF